MNVGQFLTSYFLGCTKIQGAEAMLAEAEASCFYDDTEGFLGKKTEFVLCWMVDPWELDLDVCCKVMSPQSCLVVHKPSQK